MRGTLLERYWTKVDRRGADECWPWLGGRVRGYGIIHVGYDADHNKVVSKAHRLGWELANGMSPGLLLVRHRCDNPPCQNPTHLELGTQLDNMRDRRERGKYVGLRGSAHGMAKLTEQDVRRIRALRKSGSPLRDIAEELGISLHNVHDVAGGRTWKHVEDVA